MLVTGEHDSSINVISIYQQGCITNSVAYENLLPELLLLQSTY
jgi:hypothetical protein